jgi:hypothetical protein
MVCIETSKDPHAERLLSLRGVRGRGSVFSAALSISRCSGCLERMIASIYLAQLA